MIFLTVMVINEGQKGLLPHLAFFYNVKNIFENAQCGAGARIVFNRVYVCLDMFCQVP